MIYSPTKLIYIITSHIFDPVIVETYDIIGKISIN